MVSGNTYQKDSIGIGNDTIQYYRSYFPQRLPCSYTETQKMQISCLSSSDWVTYGTNTVTYTIDTSTFSVTRANATLSR